MAYLPVDFPSKTVAGFAMLSFAPPLAAPGPVAAVALAALGRVFSPLAPTALPVPPRSAGSGGSVGYPH